MNIGAVALSSLFGIVFTAILGLVGYRFRNQTRGRRLWRLKDPQGVVIFLAPTAQANTGKYIRLSTGIGQARALALISPSLVRTYPRQVNLESVVFSFQDLSSMIEHDLIVVGGPKDNEVTRRLLMRMPELPLSVSGDTLVWSANGSPPECHESRIEDSEVVEDVGAIIRVDNPFNPSKRAVILMGSHTYGVVAAARFFTERLIGWRYWKKENFVGLVRAAVVGSHVTEPILQEWADL